MTDSGNLSLSSRHAIPSSRHAIIDTHADTPQRFVDEGWDFTGHAGTGHLSLADARAGSLGAEFMVAWAEPVQWRGRYRERTLALIDAVHQQVERHPAQLVLALSADDIEQASKAGKFAMLLAVEGGHSIENSLDVLRLFYERGVRYMTLTWSNSNEWADSSGDADDASVTHHGGLTAFGRSVVREMNRLGMMVDISHVADNTFWQVLETTRAPVLASHSSARALCNIPRNMSDEMMRAVATSNGVVMVNFYAAFLDERFRDGWNATADARHALTEAAAQKFMDAGQPVPYEISLQVDRAFYARELQDTLPLPSFDTLIDHFDHVTQVAGIDHVGIGTDFDGFSLLPQGIATAADLPKVFEALEKRGYTQVQLEKLARKNLLRVFRAVEAQAVEAAAEHSA
jgi:membrane dipeptidase